MRPEAKGGIAWQAPTSFTFFRFAANGTGRLPRTWPAAGRRQSASPRFRVGPRRPWGKGAGAARPGPLAQPKPQARRAGLGLAKGPGRPTGSRARGPLRSARRQRPRALASGPAGSRPRASSGHIRTRRVSPEPNHVFIQVIKGCLRARIARTLASMVVCQARIVGPGLQMRGISVRRLQRPQRPGRSIRQL